MWEIWKARNEGIFQGKKTTTASIIGLARLLDPPIDTQTEALPPRTIIQVNKIPQGTNILLIDGSWDIDKNAGWGATLYDQEGILVWAWAGYVKANDPLHGEALAL